MNLQHNFLYLVTLVVPCFANFNYVKYVGYSASAFDAVAGVFAPTEFYCLLLSYASPLSNGVVYNDGLKSCKLLENTNNDIVVYLGANSGWTTYVKDISGQSRLLFKATRGINSDSLGQTTGAIFTGDPSGVGSTITPNYTAAVASNNRDTSCMCNYRNPAIDQWSTLNFPKVTMQFIANGLTVMLMTFKSPGTTAVSWFLPTNMLGVFPYNFQTMRLYNATDYVHFSIYGHLTSPPYTRGFEIATLYVSCGQDMMYFTTSSLANMCAYEAAPWPAMVYSMTQKTEIVQSAATGQADFLAVTAELASRVVFQ